MPLPQSVTDLVELPGVTDIGLHILRTSFPDMTVVSEIEQEQTLPFILVRRERRFTRPGGDERGIAASAVDVNVFTTGIDADQEGETIMEAIRVAFRDAWMNRMPLPGGAVLVRVERELEPYRSPDWATATGPVQYADLPSLAFRWECSFRITYRRSHD